jgi:hypothetical protein
MSARDENEQFGTAEDYTRALQAIMADGIPHRHSALLQAHFDSPQRDQQSLTRQLEGTFDAFPARDRWLASVPTRLPRSGRKIHSRSPAAERSASFGLPGTGLYYIK